MEKNYVEENKWKALESYFARAGKPVGQANISVELHGIYSLPQDWIRIEEAGFTSDYQFEVDVADCRLEAGQFHPRELTEEEQEKMEAEKTKKKPQKKGEQPTQEEIDRLEAEKKEKEELRRQKEAEFEALSEADKLIAASEDPTKNPWIDFSDTPATLVKEGETLVILEEQINEDKGLYLKFNKLAPPEDPKKKKNVPKGAEPKDMESIETVGWLDLSEFYIPGTKTINQRVYLQTKKKYDALNKPEEPEEEEENEEKEAKEEKGGKDAKEEEEEPFDPEAEDCCEEAKTYLYLSITIDPPVNPPLPEKPIPDPSDMIIREKVQKTEINSENVCADFKRQLKIVMEAIAKEYENFVTDNPKGQSKKEKTNLNTLSTKKNELDQNISAFTYNFNKTGKADLLKEKLKRSVTRIVREKYNKKAGVRGIFKDERDQFYSELFAYLTDEIKITMEEYVSLKKEELHDDILTSYNQSRKEVLMYASKTLKEKEERRLERLSLEYEIMDEMQTSLTYFANKLTKEEDSLSWAQFAKLNKKVGQLEQTEVAVSRCVAFEEHKRAIKEGKAESIRTGKTEKSDANKNNGLEEDELNFKILFAAIQDLKGRLPDAIFYLNSVFNKAAREESKEIEIKHTNCFFCLFLAFLYRKKGDDLLFTKFFETAKRFRMRSLNMLPSGAAKNVSLPLNSEETRKEAQND